MKRLIWCMIRWTLTAFLVRWLNIVAIANQSSYGSTYTVTIGFFSFFIQEIVWHKTGVALVHNVLKKQIQKKIKQTLQKAEMVIS